ncbi:MAG: glycosyltransferase family 4 protein [Desulfomonilaceae bacterium]|nr:glycosyltransferase family 4 protein [Desulfomonilaceae bacterium]
MGHLKVGIIYNKFLDATGQERTIGGIQTYLWHLAALINELGAEPLIFQCASVPFERKIGPLVVVGVATANTVWSNFRRDLYNAAVSRIEYGKDILIFGAYHDSVPTRNPKCISIQHGLSWDAPARFFLRRIPLWVPFPMNWRKRWVAYRAKRYFENCPNRVCADYNFLNWYRTQIPDKPSGNVWVIPNFVEIPEDLEPELPRPWKTPVRIICARRFIELRGSRLMEIVGENLLARHANIDLTFAGDGPDLNRLRSRFESDPRVRFIKYMAQESVAVHLQYDIAVIPSIAFEAITLSATEAMAAGCAVVATNVGGLTNAIIDGYNGRLVEPEAECLTEALSGLVEDDEQRLRLGLRARETAKFGFNLERWKKSWTKVLRTVERI